MSTHRIPVARCTRVPRRTAFALALLGALAAHPALAQNYRYISEFGTSGTGMLDYPNDVQIDPLSHHLFVSDAFNNRVVEFNSAGAYLNAFGTAGTGNGQFAYPAGIAIDPASHNIYVADYDNYRVEAFSSAGAYLSQFSIGAGNNACAVAIQPGSHNILVSDGYSAGVQVFGSNGIYSGTIGSATNFGYACSMAIAANGNILVADQTVNNVQVFSAGGSFLSAFGSGGSGDGQFATPSPAGLAIDPVSGNIVVADYGNNRIEIFDPSGNYLSQFGGAGTAAGEFSGPTGVAIDPATHNLFIADRGNNRIQEFTSCGPTQVELSVLPLTQQINQSTFFSVSIVNVLQPGGVVSIYGDDGTLLCSAATYGDPQASCSGILQLGVHTVTATWSGDGFNPSGCSAAQTVAVVTNLTPTGTTVNIVGPPNGINQGYVFTLDADVQPAGPRGTPATAAPPSGFVTFYDGTNVLGYVPINGTHAVYSNHIVGGPHNFSASYSGDGTYATGSGNMSVSAAIPADEIYYDSFEVRPGN